MSRATRMNRAVRKTHPVDSATAVESWGRVHSVHHYTVRETHPMDSAAAVETSGRVHSVHHGAVRETHPTSRRSTQRGFILLPVVLAIVLIATIAVLLNYQGAINVDTAAGEAQARQAEAIAAAGLAHATWGAQNSGCAGDMGMTTVPFGQAGNGSYTATVTTPGGTTSAYPNLAVVQDAWIRSDNITDNNGTANKLHLRRESGDLEYTIVRFDLSSIRPGHRSIPRWPGSMSMEGKDTLKGRSPCTGSRRTGPKPARPGRP